MDSLNYSCSNGLIIFNGLNDKYGLYRASACSKNRFNLSSHINPLWVHINHLYILGLDRNDVRKAQKYNNVAFLLNLKIKQIMVNEQLGGYAIDKDNIIWRDQEDLNIDRKSFNIAINQTVKYIINGNSKFIIETPHRQLNVCFNNRSLEIISFVNKLGKGKQAKVYKIYSFATQTFQALKISTNADKVTHEFRVLNDLSNRSSKPYFQIAYRLTTIFGQAALQGPLYSEDLYRGIMGPKAQEKLSQEVKMAYCHQLCLSLKEMFALGYTHGDLKPENVFLIDKNHVVLADFDDAMHHNERFNTLLAKMHQTNDFPQLYDLCIGTYTPEYIHMNCVNEILDLCYQIFQHRYDMQALMQYEVQLHQINQKRDVFALIAIIGNILTGYDVKPTMNRQILDNETLLDDITQNKFDEAQRILKQDYEYLQEPINVTLSYPADFNHSDLEEILDILLATTKSRPKKTDDYTANAIA